MTVELGVLRLATRGSRLALAQTELARRELESSGRSLETVVVETRGDREQTTAAADMSGQGWFTSEIERRLAEGDADIAVHSAKDLPSELALGLVVSAYLARGDCRDALVSRDGNRLTELPPGAVVATSSPRRSALIAALNPGCRVIPLRGNVDSRLRRLDAGEFDALVIAAAGLDRLGLSERITERLDPTTFVPAPAQGVIALETAATGDAAEITATADSVVTRGCVAAERSLLVALGGGCLLPLGAWASITQGTLHLVAALPRDGGIRRAEIEGPMEAAADLGRRLAQRLQS